MSRMLVPVFDYGGSGVDPNQAQVDEGAGAIDAQVDEGSGAVDAHVDEDT